VTAGTVRTRVAHDASGGRRRRPGLWGRASGRGCAGTLITPLPGPLSCTWGYCLDYSEWHIW